MFQSFMGILALKDFFSRNTLIFLHDVFIPKNKIKKQLKKTKQLNLVSLNF